MKKLLLCSLVSACLASGSVLADAIPQLKQFVNHTKTLSAQFSQVVVSKKKEEKSTGTLAIKRPGQFSWTYAAPYNQLIVGDGQRLWIYDKELQQVTSRNLDAALGSSPAALLAGSNAIEKNYRLKEAGKAHGMDWLIATPKQEDGSFQSVSMGFANNELLEMRLKDNFGNNTIIKFDQIKKNPNLPSNLFQFTPPKGVDVIAE